jgi:glycosyltransferase involved in cell wall biosynthesis
MREVAAEVPGLRAVVVGDGVLRVSLESMASIFGLGGHVTFTGHQPDVASWLQRSRIFMLTSDSEGLALSLMEAMTCGAVPVVSAVGELPTLVEHGENGYVVSGREPHAFAAPVLQLLKAPEDLERFSSAAVRASRRFELQAVAAEWERAFDGGSAGLPAAPGLSAVAPETPLA